MKNLEQLELESERCLLELLWKKWRRVAWMLVFFFLVALPVPAYFFPKEDVLAVLSSGVLFSLVMYICVFGRSTARMTSFFWGMIIVVILAVVLMNLGDAGLIWTRSGLYLLAWTIVFVGFDLYVLHRME